MRLKYALFLLLSFILFYFLSDIVYGAEYKGNPKDVKSALLINGILLVNKENPLPVDYGSDNTETDKHLKLMVDAAKVKGHSLNGFSGYRSYERQEELFNKYIADEIEDSKGKLSKAEAQKIVEGYSSRPGYSEHQTGLTYDIKDTTAKADCEFKSCGNTDAMKWLKDNSTDYGFILRYTSENQNETGFDPEFWHYRFIGVEEAKRYKSENASSLESFLKLLTSTGDGDSGSEEPGDNTGGVEGEDGIEEYVHKSPFKDYVVDIKNIGINQKLQNDSVYKDIKIGKVAEYVILVLMILCWAFSILSFFYLSLLWMFVLLARTRFEPAYMMVEKMTLNKIDVYEDFGKLIKLSLFLVLIIAIVMSGLMNLIFAYIYKIISLFLVTVFRL